ncbi:MAG: hypothetical protein JRE40_04235, partial [Deltaproteobacteria bacterium]|nr:hypothetical protein [Deltaproteobacteria bacterium]
GTANTAYVEELRALEKTLDQFGLDKCLSLLPSLGSWEENCIQKTGIIATTMKKYPDRPVVWIDADARIISIPHMLMNMPVGIDFAVHYCYTKRQTNVLNSGTLYFAPTKEARELVRLWEKKNVENPKEWDQRNLQAVVKE